MHDSLMMKDKQGREIVKPEIVTTNNRIRALGRVRVLEDALIKVRAKMKKYPDSDKMKMWENGEMEYMESLSNIKQYGQERKPNGNPTGVLIGNPV